MEKLLGLFKSRKFWAAFIGLAFVFVKAYAPNFPLDEQQVLEVVVLLVGYILGVAIDDGLRK